MNRVLNLLSELSQVLASCTADNPGSDSRLTGNFRLVLQWSYFRFNFRARCGCLDFNSNSYYVVCNTVSAHRATVD